MAGNVKEWCWTETNRGRFLVGGAWNETKDRFATYDARGPFERAPEYGFRVAKYIRPLPPTLVAPVGFESLVRDARKEQPVGDDIFEVYRRQYAYDSTPLNAVDEATEETAIWRRHTVVIDAAYNGERMRVHLFLPKHGSPPYQTVIFFPPGDAFVLPSSRDLSLRWGDFILRSGRAFLYPVYKGTYERATSDKIGSNADRELRIAWSRDLGRAIDYLWTRPDIDRASAGVLRRERGKWRCDPDGSRTAFEDQRALGGRDRGRCAARMGRAQLCAAHPHPDADVDWALRLRGATRDGATSAVRLAGNSG